MILNVQDRSALIEANFNSASVILLPRTLSGDFNALARDLEDFKAAGMGPRVQPGERLLKSIEIFAGEPQGQHHVAARAVMDDVQFFARQNLRVALRLERSFSAASEPDPFHQDRLDAVLGRILCNYNTPATEWILPEDAVYQRRQGLFTARQGADIHRFPSGALWRFAGTRNEAGAAALIHRAPRTERGAPPRLLLVADRNV